jgi:hypothetical protein
MLERGESESVILEFTSNTLISVSSLLYFTDDAPEGLAAGLTKHFPSASKVCMTAMALFHLHQLLS